MSNDRSAGFTGGRLQHVFKNASDLGGMGIPEHGSWLMNASYEIYVLLLKRFLIHEISVNEFQIAFFAQFQAESEDLDEALFLLLDELFGDVDSYTDDPELLAKDPEFYLDADRLLRKANDILKRMTTWLEQAGVLR